MGIEGDGEGAGERELLVRAASDVAAFEAVYRRYVRRVTAYAVRRCRSADDVADVVAQTFFRLITAAARYDPARAEPVAFVYGIAANVIREHDRRLQRQQSLVHRLIGHDLLDGDEAERVDAAIDAAARARGLGDALGSISAAEQDVLRLVAGGRTPGQAAAELGISAGAARVRLARARRRLRGRLLSGEGATTGQGTRSEPR
jgi:RNA polymerase sigma-70 factor (ECF subfamily)